MPGQLDIKNNSKASNILISVSSIDRKLVHVKNKRLSADEMITTIVKGGTKKLTISDDNGSVIWDGVVPSYGTSAIQIFPEMAIVKYKDVDLVNLLKYQKSNFKILNNPRVQILIAVCLLILICAIAAYYIRKK